MNVRSRIGPGLTGAAVAVAVIGGAYAAERLLESGARVATLSDRNGVLQAQAKAHPKARVVPFLGPFALNPKQGKRCGPEVRIMEGALRLTIPPVRKAPASNCIGAATVKQIRAFQKRHHIPQTGIYGNRTHLALTPRYSKAQRDGLIYIARLEVIRKERATILVVTTHAINVGGGSLAYCQSGSRSYFPPWPRLPPCTDCSGFVTWVLAQSGVGERVGYYGPGSPVGWTGTLANQGKNVPVSVSKLAIGDVILYGYYPYGHTEIYVGHGQTVGHGGPGVHIHAWNYRYVGRVRRMIF